MRVGIVGQKDNATAAALSAELRAALRDADVSVVVDEVTAAAIGAPGVAVDEMDDCDMVASIGGDGTFLFAARGAGSTPVVGVNLGEVGFLNAVAPDDAVEVILAEVERARETGSPRVRSLPRLVATGEDWTLDPAINEVVIQGAQRGHGQGVDLTVAVDGSRYVESHADGVLVATPTGSSAYNLSESGPLVHPDMDAMVITAMVAEEPMPPLVVDQDSEVRITVEGAAGYVVSDGRTQRSISPPTTVTVSTGGEPMRVAGPDPDFFEALGKLD